MSILLAKHIRHVLSEMSDKVFGGIFLDGLNRETVYPYIIYQYNVSPDTSTKDGDIYNCNVTISIYSKEGDISLEMADEVKNLMLTTRSNEKEFEVLGVEFSGYRGNLDVDVYERELEFKIKTTD